MRPRPIALALLLLVLAQPARSDQVFPARLQLRETAAGTFDVTFTLPIVAGRKLRAEPQLPPSCADASPREAALLVTGHTTTWSVRCDPPTLAGEAILINGLLGTQVDVMLELSTRDGRAFQKVLKPSRPGFLVPEPPSPFLLAVESAVEGMRRPIRLPALWLVLLVVVAGRWERRAALTALLAFGLAHAAGHWLVGQSWLLVLPQVLAVFALLFALLPALWMSQGRAPGGWAQPAWVLGLLLGLLLAGARGLGTTAEGLSRVEQVVAAAAFDVGVVLGAALLGLAMRQLLLVARFLPCLGAPAAARRFVGYVVGVASLALLVQQAAGLLVVSPAVPRAGLALVLLAALLGVGAAGTLAVGPALVAFSSCLALGLGLGLAGIPLPLGQLLVYGPLAVLGVFLALGRPPSGLWVRALAAVAVAAHGWELAFTMAENQSLAVAHALGTAVGALSVLVASRGLAGSEEPRRAWRILGAATALLAVAWRLGEYEAWLSGPLATDAALGRMRVPLLTLALLVGAVVLWPRRRRVLVELGVERRRSSIHWALLGLAFLVLPLGTLSLPRPFFEAHAPQGDDARRVVGQVLSRTYHAFNLESEDELYDRLAESVTGDLVADLYLDSRRRLTAGTREGASVTVREVNVIELDDSRGIAGDGQGFAYAVRWEVIARVQHLQHIHHRQNIYNGILTLEVDDDRFKIAGVELLSEDRVVLPWQPT